MFELAGNDETSLGGLSGLGASWSDTLKDLLQKAGTAGAARLSADDQLKLAKAQAMIAAGQGNQPAPMNWTPWIIGGAVVLLGGVLLLGMRKRR